MKLPHWVIVALIVIVAVARVASTYATFNATYDEPWHLAIGMEPLEYGSYTYELKRPPLAPIAVGLGPYLAGARSAKRYNIDEERWNLIFQEGAAILHQDYWRNLTLARLGVLPFFALTIVVTYLWGRRWFSPAAGLWGAALVSLLPPLLGHAGVATSDVACAGATALALYQFLRWAEAPGWKRAAWLGGAVALAFLSKFSSVVFLGACFVVGLAVVFRKVGWRRVLADATVAAVVAIVLMWAMYGFTVERLADVAGEHPRVDALLEARPWLRPAWDAAMSVPLPLTELVRGLHEAYYHNRVGHDSYLLGKYRLTGWWYFFPVVLAVKTPLAFLLLAVWAAGRPTRPPQAGGPPYMLAWLFAGAILAGCLATNINLGVRHILPIYVPLAVLAGDAVARRGAALVPVGLAALVAAESALAHPDYLAYFNLLAGSHPEKILSESDLDWGQDLHRLSLRLRELGVKEVAIDYFGSDLLHKAGLPEYRALDPHQPSAGYIAVSVRRLSLDNAKNGSYAWLKTHTPQERIGKSIDLFYIKE